MDLFVRAYNDGVAFRYKLYRSEKIGSRKITRELTTFSIPDDPKAWIVEYGGYSTSNESEFFEHKLSYLKDTSIAGMPLLMNYGNNLLPKPILIIIVHFISVQMAQQIN